MGHLIKWEKQTEGRLFGYCGRVQVANIHPLRDDQKTLCLNIEIPFDSHKGEFTNERDAMAEAEEVVAKFKRQAGW